MVENLIITVIPEALQIEWLADKRIAVCTYLRPIVKHEEIDLTVFTALDIARNWNKNQPYLFLYDYTQSGIVWSKYGKWRWEQSFKEFPPELKGRLGMVVPRSFLLTVLQQFIKSSLKKSFPHMENNLFFSREAGLNWLRELL